MFTFPALPVFVPVNPALLDTQLLIAVLLHVCGNSAQAISAPMLVGVESGSQ